MLSLLSHLLHDFLQLPFVTSHGMSVVAEALLALQVLYVSQTWCAPSTSAAWAAAAACGAKKQRT